MRQNPNESMSRGRVSVFALVSLLCVFFSFNSPAYAQAAHSADITWTLGTESDLAGHEVYRGNGTCAAGPLQPLLDVTGAPVKVGKVSAYTDVNLPTFDGELCYEILAFDTALNKSTRSVRAKVTVNFIPPAAPLGLQILNVK